jgi:uncharacterized membrane protein YfcA
VIGAVIADALEGDSLTRVFGSFAVLAGLQLVFGRKPEGERPLPGQPGVSIVGLVIGAVSSLIGIGGGALTGPWQLWHGIKAQNAVATSAACGYPIAIAGTASFVALGLGGGLRSPALPLPARWLHRWARPLYTGCRRNWCARSSGYSWCWWGCGCWPASRATRF